MSVSMCDIILDLGESADTDRREDILDSWVLGVCVLGQHLRKSNWTAYSQDREWMNSTYACVLPFAFFFSVAPRDWAWTHSWSIWKVDLGHKDPDMFCRGQLEAEK